MRKIMACLDAGSDSIKLVVGELFKKKVNILAATAVPSEGIRNGILEDSNLVLEGLAKAITRCEEMIGLKIHQIVLSVPSNDAIYEVVNGSIEVNSEGNVITGKDVIRVIASSVRSYKKPNDYEIISIIPTNFILDDDRVVKDPKGLTSKVIGVRGVVVLTPKRNLYPLLACLEKLNIDVMDVAVDVLGDYYEFRNKDLDKKVGAVINIGSNTSTVGIFNNGILTNSKVIGFGGKNIDNDIAFVFKVPNETAKSLKESFALCSLEKANDAETVEVLDKQSKKVIISKKELTEVVKSRLDEIINLCVKDINVLTKKEISYIIFTGGLGECKDFKLLLSEKFGPKAYLGEIKEIGVRNNKYSSCVGLIKYYANNAQLKDKDFSIFSMEEQQELSGASLDSQNENVISKLFCYIFEN